MVSPNLLTAQIPYYGTRKKCCVLFYVKPNLVLSQNSGGGGGEGGSKMEVAQNDLKHVLVLEFVKSDEIFKILCWSHQLSNQTYTHHSYQISHSTCEAV